MHPLTSARLSRHVTLRYVALSLHFLSQSLALPHVNAAVWSNMIYFVTFTFLLGFADLSVAFLPYQPCKVISGTLFFEAYRALHVDTC